MVAGKIKDKVNSRWIANFIALFGLIEPVLMGTLIISCIPIPEIIALLIALAALILHYFSNLMMLLYYRKITMIDPEFSRWVKVYRKTNITLQILGSVFSFRMYKLFYSGIFGLDS